MLKIFRNVLNFRFSRKKTAASNDAARQPNAQRATGLSTYQKNLAAEIIGSGDLGRILELRDAHIRADDELDHGETAGTFALKMLEVKRQNLEESVKIFHQKHWEAAAVLDLAHQYTSERYLRAAAFLHSRATLEKLKVPQDQYPKITFDGNAMRNMASDSSIAHADMEHSNATWIATDIMGVENIHDDANDMTGAKANAKGETPHAIYEFYADNLHKTIPAMDLAKDHIIGAEAVQSIIDEGFSHLELQDWANDPILQHDFPLLKNFASVIYDEAFYARMKAAEKAQAEQKADQEQAVHDAMAEEIALGQEAIEIITTSDVSRKDIFADRVNPDAEMEVSNGTITFVTMATEVYGQALQKELQIEQALEEIHGISLEAMQEIDAMDESLRDAARFLSHEHILAALDIPNEEWPEKVVFAESADDLSDAKNDTRNALEMLRATLHLKDDEPVLEALEKTAVDNLFHADAQHRIKSFDKGVEALRSQSKFEAAYFDGIAELHKNVWEKLSVDDGLDSLYEEIHGYAANPALVEKFPYLAKFAPDAAPEVKADTDAEIVPIDIDQHKNDEGATLTSHLVTRESDAPEEFNTGPFVTSMTPPDFYENYASITNPEKLVASKRPAESYTTSDPKLRGFRYLYTQ